jgi:hypothetical protein
MLTRKEKNKMVERKMKLTKSQLKQIIKEELESLLEAEEQWPPPSQDNLNRMGSEEMERRGRIKKAVEAGCMSRFLDKIAEDIKTAKEQAINGEPPGEITQGLRSVVPWLVEKEVATIKSLYGARYIQQFLFNPLKEAIQIGSEISIEGPGFLGVSNVAQLWKKIGETAHPPYHRWVAGENSNLETDLGQEYFETLMRGCKANR